MFESVEELNEKLQQTGYFIERTMTQVAFLAAKMQRPLLLEGPAGSGKTQLSLAIAEAAGTHSVFRPAISARSLDTQRAQ